MANRHPTYSQTYAERAQTATHPLSRYLFRLMDLKASNLCLSADVGTARELLALADKVGPSIVVLKTHYDLVAGWDYNPQTGTGAKLAALARKHGFLIFEDRKFVDIGKTVQMQYTAGTARIIEWAHITNANMDAGQDMVRALAEAAAKWRERIHYEVKTSVTVGTPVSDRFDDTDEAEQQQPPSRQQQQQQESPSQPHQQQHPSSTRHGSSSSGLDAASEKGEPPHRLDAANPTSSTGAPPHNAVADGQRKGSIVSITTVTQSFEPARDSPRLPTVSSARGGAGGGSGEHGSGSGAGSHEDAAFPGIEEAPADRGLLLLAQMSSRGCLMTEGYTQACVAAAREYRQFVMGFVAQEALNTEAGDDFVHMTPGCKLPPQGEAEPAEGSGNGAVGGDGLGQQYNTPARLIGEKGTDVVIVGRGIIEAGDPPSEAERYRRRAWKAYLARLA